MPFKEMKDGKPTGRWIGKIVYNKEQVWLGNFPTKSAARHAEEVERARRLLESQASPVLDVSCDQFQAKWIVDYPRPKRTTNEHNAIYTRKFADDFKGRPLRSVKRPEARSWALLNVRHLASVRAMFNDAMNDGYIDSNPFANLRIAKPENKRQANIVLLSEVEMYALADTALRAFPDHPEYGPEFRALIIFAMHVGCRPGELFAIEVTDLSPDRAEVFIDDQTSKHNERTPTKTGNDRSVVVAPPAREALKDVPKRSGCLFRGIMGKPFTAGSFFYAWSKVRSLFGRPEIDFYEVSRHYCATMLIDRLGLQPPDVAYHLGHDDGGKQVMETYHHLDKKQARERIRARFEEVEQAKVVPLRKVGGS